MAVEERKPPTLLPGYVFRRWVVVSKAEPSSMPRQSNAGVTMTSRFRLLLPDIFCGRVLPPVLDPL